MRKKSGPEAQLMVGQSLSGDEHFLLLTDGTAFVTPAGLLPRFSLGTTLIVQYTVTDGRRVLMGVPTRWP